MDGLIFFKILNVLSSLLVGSKLNRISVAGGTVYFSFYTSRAVNYEFRASPAPALLAPSDSISGDSPGALSAVSGASVSEVGSFGYERAGYIDLKKRKQSGKLLTYRIIIEPAGNYANFFLLDGDGRILYSLSSRTIDPDRDIGAGSIYTRPKPNKRFSLDKYDGAASFADLAGFYPVTAKHAAAMLSDMTFAEVAERIKASLTDGDNFYIDKAGKPVPFFIPEAEKVVSHTELGAYYKAKELKEDTRAADRIKKIFSARKDKYERLAEKLEAELEQAKRWITPFQEAELLKANIYKVNGSGEYIFERYTENGLEEVPYTIAYGEDAQEKCEKLFRKSARLKRSVPMIEERLEEAKQMVLSADEQLYYAENAPDGVLTAEFERLISAESKNSSKKQEKKAVKKTFYEVLLPDCAVFIGRNSVSNHELVFRYANDADVWFHARNIPSAHVILRLNGGVPLTQEKVEHAASFAAAFSKNKNEQRVDVDYTYRKYVTKPKNTPTGFVTYKKFKTVAVKPLGEEEVKKITEAL